MPGRNGAAVVVVHGGGGDREGAVAHARMLSRAGYGVLLYDARGRGRSAGHENAFGWHWDRDVRGAVDFLTRRGAGEISLLGLSTGAEAVDHRSGRDLRVGAVVADGVQLRTAADSSALPTGERLSVLPLVGVLGAEIRAVTGERQPPPLPTVIRRTAAATPAADDRHDPARAHAPAPLRARHRGAGVGAPRQRPHARPARPPGGVRAPGRADAGALTQASRRRAAMRSKNAVHPWSVRS